MELRLPTLLRGVAEELNVRQASARLHLAPSEPADSRSGGRSRDETRMELLNFFLSTVDRAADFKRLTEKIHQWLNSNKGTKCEIGIKKSKAILGRVESRFLRQ
jgi:hypothetical protein